MLTDRVAKAREADPGIPAAALAKRFRTSRERIRLALLELGLPTQVPIKEHRYKLNRKNRSKVTLKPKVELTAEMAKLVKQIEQYLRKTGMDPTRFGIEAASNPSLVRRLLEGLDARPVTIERIKQQLKR